MRVTLADYPVQITLPVQWADMDAAAHVNNLVYLRWAESARIAYFARIGMDLDFQTATEGTILGWQECKYIFPMTFPDTALIGIRVLETHPHHFIAETAVFSQRHERIAALSKQQLVAYDYKAGRKIELPKFWVDNIDAIEAKVE